MTKESKINSELVQSVLNNEGTKKYITDKVQELIDSIDLNDLMEQKELFGRPKDEDDQDYYATVQEYNNQIKREVAKRLLLDTIDPSNQTSN